MRLFSVEPSIQAPVSSFSPFELELVSVVTVVVWGLQLWFYTDAKLYLLNRFRARSKQAKPVRSDAAAAPWPELETRAQAVIDKVWAKLPPEILAEAESIPLFFDEEQRRSSDGSRTLGVYRGFTGGFVSERKGPIILYLRNIEQICAENGDKFEKEVRTTYLHELGHHFGWSEREVEERGL